jgi:hypothetical protein
MAHPNTWPPPSQPTSAASPTPLINSHQPPQNATTTTAKLPFCTSHSLWAHHIIKLYTDEDLASANTINTNTPKSPGSPTSTQNFNWPPHNSTPTPSTPLGPTHRPTMDPIHAPSRRPSPAPFISRHQLTPPPPTRHHLALSSLIKPSTSIQPKRTTHPTPSLKSYTPRAIKDITISTYGFRTTHTLTHSHSRATNTDGHQTPQQPQNRRPPSPLQLWTHIKLPHGTRYSSNPAPTPNHKDTYNNASSPSL